MLTTSPTITVKAIASSYGYTDESGRFVTTEDVHFLEFDNSREAASAVRELRQNTTLRIYAYFDHEPVTLAALDRMCGMCGSPCKPDSFAAGDGWFLCVTCDDGPETGLYRG